MSKIKEFIDIAEELYAMVRDSEILANLPIEITGPWVSTIFINQHGAPKGGAAFAPKSEVLSVTGELQLKGKPKQLDNGKTQYSIKVNDEYYNSLTLECFKGRKFAVGDTVTVKYKQNGKYKNIVEVLPADDLEQGDSDIPF